MHPCVRSNLAAERNAARSRGLADHGRRNVAIDEVRRARKQQPCRRTTRRSRSRRCEGALAERLDGSHYRDDILRLMFICCHPQLPANPADRAGATHSSPADGEADRARLPVSDAGWSSASRGQATGRGHGVPFETPGAASVSRLAGVAAMIY